MKKNFMYVLFFILTFYFIFHAIYTIYMFSVAPVSGAIWLAILLLEIMIVILGYNKHIIFTFLLIFSLLLNSACSLFITAMGNDLNTRKAEYVLVLGYQLDNNNITDTLKYRLDKAYKYAKANENCKLVLCGGITGHNSISEAQVMYDYLTALGIDEERLIKEDKSTDTIENIKNSFEYITINSKIAVLSSQYHVFRAKLICKRLGLDVVGIGCYAPVTLYPNQLLFEKLGLIKMLIKT